MDFLGASPFLNPGQLAGLVAAVLLGAAIGLERQLRRHPAGLHTNALVALGSAAFVVAGTLVGDPTGPARVAGQVVTGIGFLCAGVIIHQGATIRGINTAATVWCACSVGVLAGLGLTLWAILVAVLVVVANVLLHYLEHRIIDSQKGN
jgi:putative Mg2+ transporter-C (MgtC) family protein